MAAFDELKEASQLTGKEFEISVDSHPGGTGKATLMVLDVRMDIDASCDYSITVEYGIWEHGRMFCSGARDYESLQRMISYDGK
jgi:hypothetical protein